MQEQKKNRDVSLKVTVTSRSMNQPIADHQTCCGSVTGRHRLEKQLKIYLSTHAGCMCCKWRNAWYRPVNAGTMRALRMRAGWDRGILRAAPPRRHPVPYAKSQHSLQTELRMLLRNVVEEVDARLLLTLTHL